MLILMLCVHSFYLVSVPYIYCSLTDQQRFCVSIYSILKASCGSIWTVLAYPVLLAQVNFSHVKLYSMQLAAVNRIILL